MLYVTSILFDSTTSMVTVFYN